MSHITLLVTGASGQLGRLVLHHLSRLAPGALPIVATSRTPERIAGTSATPRHADFADPATLELAFAGADRLLLISTALDNVGPRRVQQHRNAIDAAVRAGVRHIVYTSLLRPARSPLGAVAEDHAATEAMLHASGIGFTVLRNAFYMEPLRETIAAALRGGELVSANRSGRVAYVRRADCALAAACALLHGTGRQTIDIGGPENLASADIARIAAGVYRQPVAFRGVDQAERAELLAASGMPPTLARMIAHVEAALEGGVMEATPDRFAQLTGTMPQTLRAFLEEGVAAAGAPHTP